MKPGWACDNDAGIYFEDNEPKRFVSTRDAAKVYYVSVEGGKVVEKPYQPEAHLTNPARTFQPQMTRSTFGFHEVLPVSTVLNSAAAVPVSRSEGLASPR